MRQCLDAFKHMLLMILPPDEDAKHLHFTVTLIDQKVEHGPSFRHVTQSLQDRWLQSFLKRQVAQVRNVILDSAYALHCAFECGILCVTEGTIGAYQMVKDQVEVRIATGTANNVKAQGRDAFCRSCTPSAADPLPLK